MIKKIFFSKRLGFIFSLIGLAPVPLKEEPNFLSWNGSVAVSGYAKRSLYRFKQSHSPRIPLQFNPQSRSIKDKIPAKKTSHAYSVKINENIYHNLCAQGLSSPWVRGMMQFLKAKGLCLQDAQCHFTINGVDSQKRVSGWVEKDNTKHAFSFYLKAPTAYRRGPILEQKVGGFSKPMINARISSRFGPRGGRMHKGIDYCAPKGTHIFSCGAGIIRFCGQGGGFGKYIVIDHGNGYESLYAHLNDFGTNMHVGRRVTSQELIGFVGKTGRATGYHLHFEIHKNKKAVNPEPFLNRRGLILERRAVPPYQARKKTLTKIGLKRTFRKGRLSSKKSRLLSSKRTL